MQGYRLGGLWLVFSARDSGGTAQGDRRLGVGKEGLGRARWMQGGLELEVLTAGGDLGRSMIAAARLLRPASL